MNEEEYTEHMRQQSVQGAYSDNNLKQLQQQMVFEEKEKSMIHEQLNLDEEIKRIEHLTRGHIQSEENGKLVWKEPSDPNMIILTEYGIQLILNTVAWYINKNTLLSFYDNETILRKMRDFSSALNKTVFMEYEKVFKMPSFQECKDILTQRIDKKVELRMFSLETLGVKGNKETIKAEFLEQIENIIEKEMENIRESVMKTKLTRYILLIREIQDAVHSTYNRAYLGMERKTLREHIHVSETRGLQPQQKKGGMLSWFTGSN